MRTTRLLRFERPRSADPNKYHAAPANAMWAKFRERMVVNPELSSGTGLTGEYRNPQPASRDTLQVTPASKASDPAENPYYGRDFRRMYPKLQPVTQEELATLLIAAPEQLKLPSPTHKAAALEKGEATSALTKVPAPAPSLASLFAGEEAAKADGPGWMPPTPPGKIYKYRETKPAPHQPYAYFPMSNYV